MFQVLVCAALAPLVIAADAPLGVGTQWTYHGTVESRAADSGQGGKSFDLTLLLLTHSDAGGELFWLVEERGRGEFPWSERFGRVAVDRRWHAAGAGPAVLYDRGEGRSVVAVPLPFFAAEQPLAAGADFKDGALECHVDRAAKFRELPVWQVDVRDAFGPKRTLLVDTSGPLVRSVTERLTMGRGEPYELKLEFAGSEQLTGENLSATVKAIDRLTVLRGKLGLPSQSQEVAWKPEQLELLGGQLPGVSEAAVATSLEKLAATAARDLQLQSGRKDALAELGMKSVGREVDDFTMTGSAGESLRRQDLPGHVTVLHFWDYRDEPLKEPYGQVGYLDFLHHKRKSAGVQIFGVAVDGRLADDKTRAAAERSVRKLKSFMNLSYPVVLDTSGVLKQFGDPRLVGASLPLFVVIGSDGKVAHYHAGHYDVHQDQGLKELDAAVSAALEKK